MENNEILKTLFLEVSDKQMIRFKIIENFKIYKNVISIESFFYQYNKALEKTRLDFLAERQEKINRYKSSIEYNNNYYSDSSQNSAKWEMNKHNLNQIQILESSEYASGKHIGYSQGGDPMFLNYKESDFKEIERIIDDVKNIILESSKYNPRLKTNEYPNIFKSDLGYSIFYNCHQKYKSQVNFFSANYSFLYHRLEKMLICSGPEFVDFLFYEFKIKIPKIDFRKINTKSKMGFYTATVSRLLYDL